MPGVAEVDKATFVERYGGLYEHSPWVAEQACEEAAGIADPDHLAEIFARHVDAAADATKLALIRAHPDLAGKAAVGARRAPWTARMPTTQEQLSAEGERDTDQLTQASREEQTSAGIDQCTPEEYDRFQDLNHRYKQKFGFPYIMAVRGSNRHEILETFAARLENDRDTEFAMALAQIHKIARLRLQAAFRI